MSDNPYASPTPVELPPQGGADRGEAVRGIRLAMLILLAPAVYNFIWFSGLHPRQAAIAIPALFLLGNIFGFLLSVVAIWFFGLVVLEFVSASIHAVFGRKTSLDEWNGPLYTMLTRAHWFAIPGAFLWVIWVIGFYLLHINFYTVSVPIGIASHLLAACLYLPLFAQWYALARA